MNLGAGKLKPIGQVSKLVTQRGADAASQVQIQCGGRIPSSLSDLSVYSSDLQLIR